MNLSSQLPTANLENKRVFLRADLNVPLKDNTILSDYRLLAIKPTLDLIQQKNSALVLATHIGRPKNREPHLSTRVLIPWFEQHGYNIVFCETVEEARTKKIEKNEILLLENLRFFPGEKTQNATFARQLADLADYYVNDAFALLHRNDTSITLVPELFTPDKRSIGLLIEKELQMLHKLVDNPAQPFVVFIGGGKIQTKLPLLRALLDKAQIIVLCPATVFTFLKALGKKVGKSLIDNENIETSKQFLELAQKKNVKVILPIDYYVAQDRLTGPISIVSADDFPENGVGIAFGPKTLELLQAHLNNAKTIFYNGLMGVTEYPATLEGSKATFKTIGKSNAFSVIGGGDSVAVAQECNADISYLSTGGGATLAFIAGESLPGLQAFR